MARRLCQMVFPVLGLLAGITGSYLFSPTFMGIRVFAFPEWFSRYEEAPRGGATIAVRAFVGLTLGIFTSAIVCARRPSSAA